MRISRLYVPIPLNIGQQVELQEQRAHYVRTVLRLKEQQRITLFNGEGKEYLSTLVKVCRKTVALVINEEINRTVESSLTVMLGLGISRGDRMDWAVQKAVELGVSSITPLITERCVVKFKGDKKQQRLQHWKNIIEHAAEQSGRTVLPELNEVLCLQDWLALQNGLKVFLDPSATKCLAQLEEGKKSKVTLLAGPEGGFTEQEGESAIAADFVPIRLGNRILRTETACLAALSAVQVLWGDFG